MRYRSTVPVAAAHVTSICDDDTAVACALLGAAGAASSVVAVASLEKPEQPLALHARTRYPYSVFACRPVFWYDSVGLATLSITANVPSDVVLRSMKYFSTLPPDAAHVRSIRLDENVVAASALGAPGGAAGAAGVVTDASIENAEQFALSQAFTRYV